MRAVRRLSITAASMVASLVAAVAALHAAHAQPAEPTGPPPAAALPPAAAPPASPPPTAPSGTPVASGSAKPSAEAPGPDDPKKSGDKPADKAKKDDRVPKAPARAQAPPVELPPLPTRTDLAVDQKRTAQDYDGRPEHTTTGQDALWIPRILFFPVYVVTDFLIRRPLGALDTWVESNDVISKVTNAFTFGPHNNVGLVPTAFIDFGFRPSVGLYYFYDDLFTEGNNLRMTVATGGARYLKASVADRIPLHIDAQHVVKTYLQLEIDGSSRPDLKFWGIGYDAKRDDVGRFELRTRGGGARVHADFWKGTFFEAWINGREDSLADGDCTRSRTLFVSPQRDRCQTTTLLEQVRDRVYPLPPGFSGYGAVKLGARVVLDSRAPRPAAGSGVAIDLRAEQGTVLSGADHGSWITYGGSLGGFLDLTGTRRVLGLVLDARFADSLESDFAIPFTSLIGAVRVDTVPEDNLMLGFLPGRLLGTSSATATLEYEWPIWAFLDGMMQAAVGNVYSDHLKDFRPERNRFSFVGGIRSPNHRDHQFNVLVGFGTRTFEQGGQPESLRLVLGGTTGF